METKQKRKKNTIAEDEEERNKKNRTVFCGKKNQTVKVFFVQPSFTLLLFSIFVDVHVDVGKDQLELLGKEKS
jgi:hypothetical protein